MHIKNQHLLELLDEQRDLADYNLEAGMHDGFAYSMVPVIVPKTGCKWDIEWMEWGFIPGYLFNREAVEQFRRGGYDNKGRYNPPITTLNAVGEELLQLDPVTNRPKMYREAALTRRCLFISTGFFEWRHIYPVGKKGNPLKTAIKYPYHIGTRQQELHFTAGIWQPWTDKSTGETINTCALVTTAANPLMKQIHNVKWRMPTILTCKLAGEWISDNLSEERITELATFQFPADQMEAWPVSKDFKTTLDPLSRFDYGAQLPALLDVV